MISSDKCKQNFGFLRKSGILMPVSSLPSSYGIGNFGKGAYAFVDFLSKAGQKCWQVLPLNPTSYGDSPYQSPASMAGNPYFIDPEILYKKKLITKDELKDSKNNSKKVDYGWLFSTRYPLLRIAHSRFSEDSSYRAFLRKEASWIKDYALFMTLKVIHGYAPWNLWNENYRDYKKAVLHCDELACEMNFWMWVQYEFFTQWRKLKAYASSKKIVIIGDMPIYVAHDSMDVWRAPGEFLLDESYNPKEVAGCPPDAYAEDGQLWGNPIYNWDKMEDDSFSWWCDRVKAAFKLYDILRIDHFRGFASFYSIPYGDENARRGKWVKAPGLSLFKKIKQTYPKAKIIAEDLGFITDDVRELLNESGFPGMKLLQFAFYDESSEYLPANYTTDNCIVYTGSHDSDCTRSWASGLAGEERRLFLRVAKPKKGQSKTYALIELAMKSRANLAIIPMQDFLELTNDEARMNTPSVPEGNWGWRLSSRALTDSLAEKIKSITKATRRAN